MKQIAKILLFFLAAQAIGLFAGITLINSAATNPAVQLISVTPIGTAGEASNSAVFLAYVLVGALMMILILKFYKGLLLFKLVEAMTLFISTSIIFFAFFVAVSLPYDWLWAGLMGMTATGVRFIIPGFRNYAAILASAGVGAVFGFSLDIVPALIFVVGLSIYDFIAVYFTKHMVYMAKELSKRQLAFSVQATEVEYVEELKKEAKTTLELGTGDLAIPLMLAVSSYKLKLSIIHPLAAVLGASIGLIIVLWYVTSRRSFLPALPPIALLSMLFLGIATLFF